tara:strand:+ start:987 stop:1457 length:471 start_codon:yes stop_codon:yes gene_type:complete
MTQYKDLIKNLVEDVARDDLGKAGHTFKSIMASKLMESLSEHSVKVQNTIAEAYPEIFDSPVDVEAATGTPPSIEDYPADSEDDNIDPEEAKQEGDAHYEKGEDEEVYEQVVIEQGGEDDEELEEEDKPDFADIDGDGDEEESMKQAAKDKEQGAS